MRTDRMMPRLMFQTLVALNMIVCAVRANADNSTALPGRNSLDLVLRAQARRVEMIERVAPSVVCVYDASQRGGGSGVLIDREGYGLTNFHVVHALKDTGRGWGGLSDGTLYELEVLGIDPTGDVAMFRLIGADSFPHAMLGNSDAVNVGDVAVAMGNPFSLSDDHSPSVTMGIVTGTHRYQSGVKGNLTYSDCIQVDAAINPGNSGGPLFNSAGEVIGINGRISINRRGRFNVGFGYAITSNQIRRFIPALRAGLLARHGTLQAIVEDRDGQGTVFSELIRHAAAYTAGIRVGDRLLEFDGVPITSANHFASLLGTYPAGWDVPLVIERAGVRRGLRAQLEPITPKMRQPFYADPEANLRQVRRVLSAYCAAVIGDGACMQGEWAWTVERSYEQGENTAPGLVQTFEVVRWGDGTVRMVQRVENEVQGRIIEYDQHHAIQRNRNGSQSAELPEPERLALRAIHMLQGRLLDSVDNVDPANVAHAGGISQIRAASGTPNPGAWPLEVLDWRLGDDVLAKFVFDSDSHLVVRAIVVDLPTAAEVTIEFSEHRNVGGVVLPCRMRVRGSGLAFEDVLTDWELTP